MFSLIRSQSLLQTTLSAGRREVTRNMGSIHLRNANATAATTGSHSGADELFHLGLSSADNLPELFGDVKFFCTGGSAGRIRKFADKLAKSLPKEVTGLPFGSAPQPIGSTERYEMYKVGPVLMVNHGMGIPSTTILLHEVTKLLSMAGADDPAYIRLGTSGGIGLTPGTVVVTTEAVNGMLEPAYKLPILGKMVSRETKLHEGLAKDILAANSATGDKAIPTARGMTMAADCFYEGQGRLDGAMCDYAEADKMEFLGRAHDMGVRNIEMEATVFSSFTRQLGIRAAVCCVTLLNRLEGDQMQVPMEMVHQFDERPGDLILNYIKQEISKTQGKGQG
jgi:uridine phosphorylase